MPKVKRQSHKTRCLVMRQRRRATRLMQSEEEAAEARRKNAERQAVARAKQSEDAARLRRKKDAAAHAAARAKKSHMVDLAHQREFEEMIRRIQAEATLNGKYAVTWQDGRIFLTPIGNNDQSNSAESYSVNEDIDIKSEILEFGPTEYLASSFLSSSDHEQDYQAIGTYFAQKIALLQPDQRTYALKFINDILNEANQGSLHSNSIEINRLPPNPLECKNAASFPQNSSHHDNNEGSRCDIKPDITKLIPIPEFNEPIATPTFNVPSTFVPPYGCNPDITDDTKPDISRLAIPGTSAAALSIIPQSIGTYEIINTSTSGSSLTQPYKDHSYIHKKADKSKTGQTDVVLPVSNFGTLSQIVVPAKITKYENVAFEIFEEKE